jgi:hypothetical protein
VHGVGLAKAVPGTNSWPERCREWMQARGWLAAAPAVDTPPK